MPAEKLKAATVKKITKLKKLKEALVAKLAAVDTPLKAPKAKADLDGFCQFLGLLCSSNSAELKSALVESSKYFPTKLKKDALNEVKQAFLTVPVFAKAVKEDAEDDDENGSGADASTKATPSGPSASDLSKVNMLWAKAYKTQANLVPPVVKAIQGFVSDPDPTVQQNAKDALQKVKNSFGKYLDYGKALTKAIEETINSVGSDQVMKKMDDLQIAVAIVENHIDNDAEVKSLMIQFEGGDFFKPTITALTFFKKSLSGYLRG